ncbi:GcrA family cell cycle regulator [Pseudovibrio exalbescens]|uniref:GcrA family cell cycle regulator n=1 Tax=Pseudovibrio exalbescens TaxID=197461 RepID=UPI003082217C
MRRKVAASVQRRTIQPAVAGATALKITPEEDDIVGDLTPVAATEVVVPVSERASILTLTERTCKWPIGDPTDEDFHFCGHSCDAASPYCEYHRTIAYQPVNDRRRERKSA